MFAKRYSFGSLLIVIALVSSARLSVSAQTTQQQQKVPLTHEAMWMMKRVGPPVPSPDGKWVVLSLVEPAYDEKDQVSDLWIVPVDGSARPRRLTATKGGESGVAWSPDSREIAFSAKREGDDVNQIYVLDVADGGEAVRVTSLSTGARLPQWRPDGKVLLFTSTVYPGAADDEANKRIAAERKAQKYRVRVYEKFPIRNWDRWLDDPRRPTLMVQELEPGARPRDHVEANREQARQRDERHRQHERNQRDREDGQHGPGFIRICAAADQEYRCDGQKTKRDPADEAHDHNRGDSGEEQHGGSLQKKHAEGQHQDAVRSGAAHVPVGIEHKGEFDDRAQDSCERDELFRGPQLCKVHVFELQNSIVEKTDNDRHYRIAKQGPVALNAAERRFQIRLARLIEPRRDEIARLDQDGHQRAQQPHVERTEAANVGAQPRVGEEDGQKEGGHEIVHAPRHRTAELALAGEHGSEEKRPEDIENADQAGGDRRQQPPEREARHEPAEPGGVDLVHALGDVGEEPAGYRVGRQVHQEAHQLGAQVRRFDSPLRVQVREQRPYREQHELHLELGCLGHNGVQGHRIADDGADLGHQARHR